MKYCYLPAKLESYVLSKPPYYFLKDIILRNILLIVLTCVGCFGAQHLSAQEYLLNVQSLSVEEGFSNRNIYQPFQDRDGYIWVGTTYGLDRYDGSRVQHYGRAEHGIRFDVGFTINQDGEGKLWLYSVYGYAEIFRYLGIDIFDPETGTTIPLSEYIPEPLPFSENEVSHVLQSKDSSMLIATIKGDIFKIKDRKVSLIYHEPEGRKIHQLYEPDQGEGGLWLILFDEVVKINDAGVRVKQFQKRSGNARSQVDILYTFYEDDTGRLHYVATQRYNPLETSFRRTNEYYIDGKAVYRDPKLGRYSVIAIAPKTFIQYAIVDNGNFNIDFLLLNANGKELARVPFDATIYHTPMFDRQGNLWLPTQNSLKLISATETPFHKYMYNFQSFFGLNYGARGMIEDGKGNLLVNGMGRSYKVDLTTGKETVFTPPFLFEHDYDPTGGQFLRSALLADKDSNIWVSDESFRLLYYEADKDKFHEYTYADSLFSTLNTASIKSENLPTLHRAMLIDDLGKLWLGHTNGLSWFNPESEVIELVPNTGEMSSLAGAQVLHIYQNSVGFWLSTNRGIYLFDSQKMSIKAHYHTAGKNEFYLPHDSYAHIYEDQLGFFWLASKGGGLIKWQPETGEFEQFTSKNGLSDNVVYAVYEDGYNQLWLPTDKGINQFDKATGDVVIYQEDDGITHKEFNTASHYRGKDSTLYFGGLNGITAFKPNAIAKNRIEQANPVVVTGLSKQLRSSGELIDGYPEFLDTNEIQLKPVELGFSLEISHLSYGTFANRAYAYKIAGLDAEWTYISEPTIRINALPYGTFELLIRAKETNGAWTEPFNIPVRVFKPFYLQVWFIMLCVLLLSAIVYWFIRVRYRRLEKRKTDLEEEVEVRTSTINEQTKVLKKQALDLQKLDSSKSQFFANISHELRTPLTLIMGPLNELLEEGKLDSKVLNRLSRMYRNSKSLSNLVEEILELSKLEAGKLEVNTSPIQFVSYVRRVFSNFESLALRRGTHYSCDISVDEQLVLTLDANKLEKIINNLLSNAIKFTDQQGFVKLTVTVSKQNFTIRVEDSGRGIAERDIPRIFDRFYQSEAADMSQIQGGTGIGLALAKELTEIMGGTLTVESEVLKGTTLTLTLPKIASQLPPVPITEEQDTDLEEEVSTTTLQPDSSKHILLVEDNLDMQNYVREILSSHYQISTADNGLQALKQLDIFRPDLIVSDVMMPEMDGFTLLKRLKANRLYSDIPVVMLTARAESEDKLNALTIGVDDYLIKPFLKEELLARLANLMTFAAGRKQTEQDQESDLSATVKSVSEGNSEVDIKWIKELERVALASLTNVDFSMETLAEQMNISLRQLQRKVKEITGLSLSKLILEIRLQQSRSYLERGTYHTVAEVSQAVGLQSPKYFSRLFKERFGKNPSEYLG